MNKQQIQLLYKEAKNKFRSEDTFVEGDIAQLQEYLLMLIEILMEDDD